MNCQLQGVAKLRETEYAEILAQRVDDPISLETIRAVHTPTTGIHKTSVHKIQLHRAETRIND